MGGQEVQTKEETGAGFNNVRVKRQGEKKKRKKYKKESRDREKSA